MGPASALLLAPLGLPESPWLACFLQSKVGGQRKSARELTVEYERERAVAEEAARAAGALLRAHFGGAQTVEHKGERDLVTALDRQAEALVIARIRAAFSDHAILAEEGTARQRSLAANHWFIDPLDGTTNYAHGYPFFAVSVAYAHQGALQVGVVYDPLRDELYAASGGAGATLNDRPLQTSTTPTLAQSLLISGFPYDQENMPRALQLWAALMPQCRGLRRDGAAALDLCYVAAGRCDGYWERHLQPWDAAAGALMVREAGGTITDFRGGPLDLFRGEAAASNGHIHGALTAALSAADHP